MCFIVLNWMSIVSLFNGRLSPLEQTVDYSVVVVVVVAENLLPRQLRQPQLITIKI